LSESVVGHLRNVPFIIVFLLFEDSKELPKSLSTSQSKAGHVFHYDHVRLERFDQPSHFQQQVISRVFSPVLCGEGTETLARSAAREKGQSLST
jgi:hypothetical protein